MKFYTRARVEMAKRQLTLRKLGEICNCCETSVFHWLNGRPVKPSHHHIAKKVCDQLGLPYSGLFLQQHYKTPKNKKGA